MPRSSYQMTYSSIVSPRAITDGDDVRVETLWRQEYDAGRADVPWQRAGIAHELMRRGLIVGPPQVVQAAAFLRDVHTSDGLFLQLEPLLAESAEAALEAVQWMVDSARTMEQVVGINVWRAGAEGEPLPELGFNHVRTYWRLDLMELAAIEPLPIPDHLRVVSAAQGPLDYQAWLDLYNRAFDGEWHHSPEDPASFRQYVDAAPEFSLAMLDEHDKPVALALARCDEFPYDRRPQPVGQVLVLCRDPEHREQRLGRRLLLECLVRLRTAGAASVSIRTDIDSMHRSHLLYQDVGFQFALELWAWERRIR